ncbi:MAG TPA: EF-P lysine aminoacylase EpmA [Stellaceae bacterium]|jgi:lysyl-tRNA synthetase class 2|nr:EF-P lysine aminoacylase EpmA [Stellaceae bacterium]
MAEWWHPDRLAARRERLAARGRILDAARVFFAGEGLVEVDTPALQVSPGMEPHLKPFGTLLNDPRDNSLKPRYLHTSPEFAMKKLLAGGMTQIWQLAHAFRDGERGATHHPEFSMLEWYRAGADYTALMADCEALLRQAQRAATFLPRHSREGGNPGRATERLPLDPRLRGGDEQGNGGAMTWRGRTADANQPFERLSVAEAFTRHTGIDILATAPDPDRPSFALLADAAAKAAIEPHPGDDWETLYFRIFLDRIEPHLGIGAPTILYDYPVSMAALSREKPGDPRLCERFELYVCGLELANAFSELTDPAEQRGRFIAEQASKQRLYGHTTPIDDDFLAALEHGLPDCAGIALGFDRLVMLCTDAETIEDVLWAPVD